MPSSNMVTVFSSGQAFGFAVVLIEIAVLVFLALKVGRLNRREHLVWISLLLVSLSISLGTQFFWLWIGSHSPFPTNASAHFAVLMGQIGVLVRAAGIIALVVTISRVVSAAATSPAVRPADPTAWPPPPQG